MPKWTDYTTKTTVADNDEVMLLDTAGKANKRLSLSTLSDWVLGKIADKVFEKLQTNDKTILGAINELNSKAPLGTITGTNSLEEYSVLSGKKPGVYKLSGVVIPGISSEKWYGALILLQTYDLQIVIVGAGKVFTRDKTGQPAIWQPWRKYNQTIIQQ